MRKLPFLFLFFVFVLNSFGQQYDKNWLLSYDYFNGSSQRLLVTWTPSMSIDSMFAALNMGVSTITMSDRNGNLLLASNGASIVDTTGNIMMNGANINMSPCSTAYAHSGSPDPQSIVCLPFPGDSNLYFLLHMPCNVSATNSEPLELLYSIIDMRGNGGLGAVVQKNLPLISDSLSPGFLTACKHSDGQSWWIFVPRKNSNVYHRILLTRNGIWLSDTVAFGTSHGRTLGRSVFSPDGKMYARYSPLTGLSLMDFDRCTGSFSNEHFVPASALPTSGAGSVEFSSNSKVLYIFTTSHVFQYDLTSSNALSNQILLGITAPFMCPLATNYAWGQLAPDNKIYITSNNGAFCISTIDYPDSLGTSCNLMQHSLYLPMPIFFFSTFPNNPNYKLAADTFDCTITSIGNIKDRQEIISYPNPARDKLFLKGAVDMNSTIEIFNVNGKREFFLTYYEGGLDISSLRPGVYFMKISTEKIISYHKFLVE